MNKDEKGRGKRKEWRRVEVEEEEKKTENMSACLWRQHQQQQHIT